LKRVLIDFPLASFATLAVKFNLSLAHSASFAVSLVYSLVTSASSTVKLFTFLRLTLGALAILVVQALVPCAALAAPLLWYEDNNLGRAGGMPPDFIEKFHHPETFREASRHIRVYMIRANVLNKMDDVFLTTLLDPYLRRNNIKLAIDATGVVWAQAPGRDKAFAANIQLLERLKRLGIVVHYISLQSVLSKPLIRAGKTVDYPLGKRIQDATAFANAARSTYPRAEIGIIDALPSHGKDYRRAYRALRDAMSREGLTLSYIHVDMPFEIPHQRQLGVTWQTLREVERYVEEELGLKFGFFTTSRTAGNISSKAFHERVMAALECYTGATGTPRDWLIASWFPHPRNTIPENAVGEDYPAMRTVLAFGRSLERIMDVGSSSQSPGRTQEPAWRALCIAG